MIEIAEPSQMLACMEVSGGNTAVKRVVELPELRAWVYARPADGQDSGGDVHYLSVCGHSILSRIVLADVSGHGIEVSRPARRLHDLMRAHINTWDQTAFVRALNRSFRGQPAQGKYATAAILGVLRTTGETAFTNAGHLPPLSYRSRFAGWSWLDEEACRHECGIEGLPVGLIADTNYRQTRIQLERGDILILYSDGITEAEDPNGEMLGRDRLMEWAKAAPTGSPEAAGNFLIRRLAEFRRDHYTDDETLIAVQRGTS